MKRHGQLMAAIAEPENLREAFLKAIRGKRGKTDCRAFQERLAEWIGGWSGGWGP